MDFEATYLANESSSDIASSKVDGLLLIILLHVVGDS